MKIVIAMDGPAGTGKSSTALALAKYFNFTYVDTGSIYRALAYLSLISNVDINSEYELSLLVSELEILVDELAYKTIVKANDKVLKDEIRTENISRLASIVSQHKKVRLALLDVQRNLLKKIKHGAIFEGRDIGTVVFPDALVKIFITASSEVRAKRRYAELEDKNISYEQVLAAIKERDERDESRVNSPTRPAKDAHIIDSSHLSFSEVKALAIKIIDEAIKESKC